MIEPITVDFETEAIVGNPIVRPPKAVGCAVWVPGSEPSYLAWGHPEFEVGDPRWPAGSKNNIYFGDAHQYLTRLQESGQPLLFHNAPFDISVWDNDFCNARWYEISQQWDRIHDTLYLLFLADPYSATFSLKPCADRYLGMAAEEQHVLKNWILQHVVGATEKNFGAFISLAPADLVGPYAVGDVVRTKRLFDLLYPKIEAEGMLGAYDRERKLFPIMRRATARGIRIDRDLLQHHESVYSSCLEIAKTGLGDKLGISGDSIDDDSVFADALDKAGAVESWTLTATGKRSMAKDNLRIKDPEIKTYYTYIKSLETCLQTFMRPWLEFSANDGRLHPNWNQVRQSRSGGDKSKGTRTGRLSSDSPNFQNVPTEFTDLLGNPLPVPEGLHPLPLLRRYCLPESGHLWLKRDYSSQEIRILAHFEDGRLCEAYRAKPDLDPHKMAMGLIQEMVGVLYARKDVKITAFSIIYGSGATGLSIQLGRAYDEAWKIKEAYLEAMPGVKELMSDVTNRGRSGSSIRTWGGRVYFAEPPKVVDGRYREYSYKLLNYLIQGSAADQTKESINDWEYEHDHEAIFLATVHDEINISAPEDDWQRHMLKLKECMNRDRLDVPVLSEGFVGPNWEDIKECE